MKHYLRCLFSVFKFLTAERAQKKCFSPNYSRFVSLDLPEISLSKDTTPWRSRNFHIPRKFLYSFMDLSYKPKERYQDLSQELSSIFFGKIAGNIHAFSQEMLGNLRETSCDLLGIQSWLFPINFFFSCLVLSCKSKEMFLFPCETYLKNSQKDKSRRAADVSAHVDLGQEFARHFWD